MIKTGLTVKILLTGSPVKWTSFHENLVGTVTDMSQNKRVRNTAILQRCPLKPLLLGKNDEKFPKWLLCLEPCNSINMEVLSQCRRKTYILISRSGRFYYFRDQY